MRIGAHQSVAGGISRSVDRAVADGAQSFQIFTKSARAWAAPPLPLEEAKSFRAGLAAKQIPAVAHGSYLVNLGTEAPELRERSIACVEEELLRCEALGIGQLILHPGSHPDTKVGLRQVAQGINQVHARLPKLKAKLCLEVTAGQGNCLGWRFEHLEEILSQTLDSDRVGVCLDTCHLFAAGYDLTTFRGYEQTLKECDRRVGIARVSCIHLNDSKKDLGCRVDRHEEIGKGQMGIEPFRHLVNDERFRDTVAVLETPVPERYAESICFLESLAR